MVVLGSLDQYRFVFVLHTHTGALVLHQLEVLGQGIGTPWPVEGVATYVHGGLSVRHFLFRCTSSSNNDSGLSWTRKNGVLDKPQVETVNGIDLDFGTNPSAADAGIYVCQDTFTSDRAELNITDSELVFRHNNKPTYL